MEQSPTKQPGINVIFTCSLLAMIENKTKKEAMLNGIGTYLAY